MRLFVISTLFFAKIAAIFGEKFPQDFMFGVATSAYQIEGGKGYGKGETVWDHAIAKNPFIVRDRANADVACDSYHRYRDDVAAIKFLGAKFYRFSLSWSRLLPNGYSNKVNELAIRYYDDLINELLKNGIEPMVTLYHRDLPQRIQEIGGWTNPYTAYYYEDYANVAFARFGDRVRYWITMNSWCYGYGATDEPPFVDQPGVANYLCQNVMMLAHAKAYHLYDAVYRKRQRGQVGITIEAPWFEAASERKEDVEAAERARQFGYGIMANPIFHTNGDWPLIVKTRVAEISKRQGYQRSRLPELSRDEIEYVQGTYDFFGLNYYTTNMVADDVNATDDVGARTYQKPEWQSSNSAWLKGHADGFRKMLAWIKERYDNPDVYVTENGYSDKGELNDTERIVYLKNHLKAMQQAMVEDKVAVKGYAVWSLLDNFEWMQGYAEKFGLFHVDFDSDQRTRSAKESAKWYKKVIAERSVDVD